VTVGADADHLAVALPGISPVENLDRHTADTPCPHFTFGGFVEVNGIATGEGKSVVIHLVDLSRCPDSEDGAAGPAGPVGGGTIHDAVSERSPQGCFGPIADMVALALRVGGGSYFLNGGPLDRGFVGRQRMGTSTEDEQQRKKWERTLHKSISWQIAGEVSSFLLRRLLQNRHTDCLGSRCRDPLKQRA